MLWKEDPRCQERQSRRKIPFRLLVSGLSNFTACLTQAVTATSLSIEMGKEKKNQRQNTEVWDDEEGRACVIASSYHGILAGWMKRASTNSKSFAPLPNQGKRLTALTVQKQKHTPNSKNKPFFPAWQLWAECSWFSWASPAIEVQMYFSDSRQVQYTGNLPSAFKTFTGLNMSWEIMLSVSCLRRTKGASPSSTRSLRIIFQRVSLLFPLGWSCSAAGEAQQNPLQCNFF